MRAVHMALAMLACSGAWAEVSVHRESPAPFRLYNGDELVQEFDTREEAMLSVINAARQCAHEPNYVYTEIVTAVNSECGKDAPAGNEEKKKAAPAVTTPTDTKAAGEGSSPQPPETHQAPAGKSNSPAEGLLLFPLQNETKAPTPLKK